MSLSNLVDRVFRDLVEAASENPPGGERAAAAVARKVLVDAGFEVRELAREADRPNVVASLRRGSGRRLILQGHLDTKPANAEGAANSWDVEPMTVTKRGGRLYGLGACDTKGGLAAQLAAAAAVAADSTWAGELTVQAVADEENGSWYGAEYLLERGELAADAAIVAEPTECQPCLAQLGNAWGEVMIVGKAAHAGRPERGQDAVAAAFRYVSALRDLVAQLPSDPTFPGHPRVNVGDVLAPGHPGSVPGECRLRCDIRVLPHQERDEVFALYHHAANLVATPSLRVEVTPYRGGGCQSHWISPREPVAAALREAQAECGSTSTDAVFFGGSDARYFAQAGTPAMVYGPGHLDQAHAPNEYVDESQLGLAAEQLRLTALRFLSARR